MSRTSWVAPGRGESLQTLLAYTVQNASPTVALQAATWMIEHAYTYERFATARTGLSLELTPTGQENDHDFARVKAVLRDIGEQGPEQYFGHDLVRASSGFELSLLDVGARQVRALAEGLQNLGRAIDRANESRLAAEQSRQVLGAERDRLQQEVAALQRQLEERGLKLAAPEPAFHGTWVVLDAEGRRFWDGQGWTDDLSRAMRFSPEQAEDKVALEQALNEQGFPGLPAYFVRDYGVEGRELWDNLYDTAAAPIASEPERVAAVLPESVPGMASLAASLPGLPALGLGR